MQSASHVDCTCLVPRLSYQLITTCLIVWEFTQAERPYYDYKYALRLCHQANKNGACVEIYRHMRLFEVRCISCFAVCRRAVMAI